MSFTLNPEISGEEAETAKAVVAFVGQAGPDRIVTEPGGHGVAMVFDGAEPGPTVLFRSEIDALPIQEISDKPYRSAIPGKAHLCGHEGHTTILAGLARGLGRQRPARGRAVLMFQPAEETGAGAAAVIADPRFGRHRAGLCLLAAQSSGLAARPCVAACRAGELRLARPAHRADWQDRVRLRTRNRSFADARRSPSDARPDGLAKGGELNANYAFAW